MNNCSYASFKQEFYIVAFPMSLVTQLGLFLGLLIIYLMTLLGNLTIIILVSLVPKLHTPMYVFLCNLAIFDITSTSTSIPKLLTIILIQNQMCGHCKPLQYQAIMTRNVYIVMTVSCWIVSALNSLSHTILTAILQFCNSHDINNFFCDLNSVLNLSSSGITTRKNFMLSEAILIPVIQFLLTIISYVFIFSAILKIGSSAGRMKAFSSCASHLITVILFYGPLMFLYMKPQFDDSKDQDMLLSMLYTVAVPMLSPLVYSLRNKDIWEAIAILIKEIKQMIY